MALKVYKPGQGYWTRLVTGVAFGALMLAGVEWICRDKMDALQGDNRLYIQAGVALVLIALGGWLLYRFLGAKPSTCDFMIATEGEMKKVNWPNRREVIGSTWVVICWLFILAIILFFADVVVSDIAKWINVIVGDPTSQVWARAHGIDGLPFIVLLAASFIGGIVVPMLPLGSPRRAVKLFFGFVAVHFAASIAYATTIDASDWNDPGFIAGSVFGFLLISLVPALLGLIVVSVVFGVKEGDAERQ